MSVITSDAVFELTGACVHSLQFGFGAPVGYPQGIPLAGETEAPPALFRRIQAVSPPPTRAGEPWYTGMTLAGEPFRPDVLTGADRLAAVELEAGISSLDAADPMSVVLDEWIRVERLDEPRMITFPGADRGHLLLSIDYWSPLAEGDKTTERSVSYYSEYRMEWSRIPEGRWVAVSFDAFYPPERDSSDLLIPIGSCDSHCPA